MPYTTQSPTNDLSLDEVIDRLSQRPEVDGIVVIGSLSGKQFKPHSDYDLLLVMNQMPVPLQVGLTYINGRLTDIIFTTFKQINHCMVDTASTALDEETYKILSWLQQGEVRHDRGGKLAIAKKMLSVGKWDEKHEDTAAIYGRWQNTNYNIAQHRRMLESGDEIYDTALSLRFLYMCRQLWEDYFLVRGLKSQGDKQDIRYLKEIEPSFLSSFQELLACQDLTEKQVQYEAVAAGVFAPFATMWDEGETSMVIYANGKWQPGKIQEALDFWATLVSEPEKR
jgi:predicted nucleotidyltransferase